MRREVDDVLRIRQPLEVGEPLELQRLVLEQSLEGEYLERLESWLSDATAEPDREIDPEMLEKLKELGYVGD